MYSVRGARQFARDTALCDGSHTCLCKDESRLLTIGAQRGATVARADKTCVPSMTFEIRNIDDQQKFAWRFASKSCWGSGSGPIGTDDLIVSG